jgi:hypothetical protein
MNPSPAGSEILPRAGSIMKEENLEFAGCQEGRKTVADKKKYQGNSLTAFTLKVNVTNVR